jgi:hypothetical protein
MGNDEKSLLKFKIPFHKKILLFLKKGIIVFRELTELDTSVENFNYNKINRLTRINQEIVTDVHSKSQDFAIYDTFEGGILIVSASSDRLDNLNKVALELSTMKAELSRRELARFKRRLANALRLGLLDFTKESKNILDDICIKASSLRINKFRLVYFLGAFSITLLIASLTILYQVFNLTFYTSWDELKLLNILLFSSIGGIFSVALGYKTLNTKIPEAGFVFYFVNGMSRILISLFAGIAAYELMMAGLFFSLFKDNNYGILCLSLLAGFTESFIPKLLDKTASNIAESPIKPH